MPLLRLLLTFVATTCVLACRAPETPPTGNHPLEPAEITATNATATGSAEVPIWPVDDSPVVARSGDAVVRASRLLVAGRFQQWLDQWAPPERAVDDWWKSDERIRSLLGSELEYAVLAEEAERLGIVVTVDDVDAQIARVEPLARLAAMSDEEREVAFAGFAPLDWLAVRRFAAERARMSAWIDMHATLPPDDALRDEWLRANDRVTLELVVVPNRHSDADVAAFVAANRARIEAEYAADPGRFTLPATATIDEVTLDLQADAQTERQRCATLAEIASDVLVSNVEPPAGYLRRTRAVQRQELPEAFSLQPGALSQHIDRDGICTRFLVVDRTPRLRQVFDEQIASLLGAEMLAREVQNAESERIARAVQISFDNPQAIEAHGFAVTRTPPFAQNDAGHVAGVGNVPALHDAIFSLLHQPGDQLPGPWFTAHGWVALRLVERTVAPADGFDAARDEFAAAWLDILRRTLWPRFLQQRAASQPAQIELAVARSWLDAYFAAAEGSR